MISAFILSYGYLAVFVGTLLEGESILLAAGFAAHRGLLDLPVVIVVAVLGATLGDQLAFLLGRWKGRALIARFPSLAEQQPRVHELLEGHATLFILTLRFLYGLRIAGPMLLGTSRVAILRFVVLNVIGAVVWALTIGGAGYAFGLVINTVLADIKRFEEAVLLVILAGGAILWMWRHWRA